MDEFSFKAIYVWFTACVFSSPGGTGRTAVTSGKRVRISAKVKKECSKVIKEATTILSTWVIASEYVMLAMSGNIGASGILVRN